MIFAVYDAVNMKVGNSEMNKPIIFISCVLVVFATVISSATSKNGIPPRKGSSLNAKASSGDGKRTPGISATITAIGENAEDTYDFAGAKRWNGAAAKLMKIKSLIRTDGFWSVPNADKDETEITDSINELEKSIESRDRWNAMLMANRVTFLAADMTKSWKQTVPTEIAFLDYYGRQLELWSEVKNTENLKSTTRDIRQTWDAVRGTVSARGGTAEGKRFETIVKSLESAKTPADYVRLRIRLLDEVDNLERVFTG